MLGRCPTSLDVKHSTRLYAATDLRVSSLRGAFFVAEEFAESDLGASFLGFLRSPFADGVADAVVDAGDLFSFAAAAAAGDGFDGGAEVCGLEASLGGAFFGSVSFLGELLLCALGAWGLDVEVCVEVCGLASGCFDGAEVRCDFRGWGLDSFADEDSVLDWVLLNFGASLGLGASFGVGACLGASACLGISACCGFCACRTACPSCCDACLAVG